MKKILLSLLITGFHSLLSAQIVLYNQDFSGASAPDLPGDWTATSSQIFTNESSPSTGYTNASGGNNLLSRNCNPNNEVRRFQVDGISSANYTDISVQFGHRRTNGFTPPVTLEWSNNGVAWNPITYNSSAAGTTWALFSSATLPSEANNQSGLSFRWSYTTNVGNVPCDNFAGNYRIDDFTVTAAAVLPVELVSFAGSIQGASVGLHWQTATERSNDFFTVERSADSRLFSEIGRRHGAGTTTEPQSYQFTDPDPMSGVNYYRLRQTDFDGGHTYSHVVAVQAGKTGGIHIFPSPATEWVKVQPLAAPDEHAVLEVFDLAGRLVKSAVFLAENTTLELSVADLPTGLYQLRYVVGQDVHVQSFMVEKQ